MVHHRHKQRMLTTIITLIVLVLCVDIFLLLNGVMDSELALLLTFGVGILLVSLYHLYNYEHCHEHLTMVNNLTQIYFGAILIVSIILMLLLRLLFNIEIMTGYIVMSIIVILLLFLTLGSYDRFLETHLGARFRINAPSPRQKKRVKSAVKR